jgi:Domain of unknown function (DUF4271)
VLQTNSHWLLLLLYFCCINTPVSRLFLICCFLCRLFSATAQTDSLKQVNTDTDIIKNITADSAKQLRDNVLIDSLSVKDSLNTQIDRIAAALKKRQADSIRAAAKTSMPVKQTFSLKQFKGDEMLFYSLILMFIFYAALKQLFPKYFTDLFRVYFRTTLKQTQVREQLLQTPLPSLLLNGFFIVSGGMYAAFLFQHFNIAPKFSFWQLWLYSGILLSIIYMMKFAGVWLAGWLFNRNDAATAYTFIVFMNNKITGIVVLPFLVLLAFGTEKIYPATLIVSITLVACLFLYRFYLSIGVIRGQAKVNTLHFLLYLSAFEVFPLLILFKWVMSFLK